MDAQLDTKSAATLRQQTDCASLRSRADTTCTTCCALARLQLQPLVHLPLAVVLRHNGLCKAGYVLRSPLVTHMPVCAGAEEREGVEVAETESGCCCWHMRLRNTHGLAGDTEFDPGVAQLDPPPITPLLQVEPGSYALQPLKLSVTVLEHAHTHLCTYSQLRM